MGSVVFRLLVERWKGPWGVCVCASVTDFTDFTSTTVILYVMLSYVMLIVMLSLLKTSECLFGAVEKIT